MTGLLVWFEKTSIPYRGVFFFGGGGFEIPYPTVPWEMQVNLVSYFPFKRWGLNDPPPQLLRISNDHLWGRYGYVLELHNL